MRHSARLLMSTTAVFCLFLLYINDLSNVAVNCFLLLFADDSNLFYTGDDLHVDELCMCINEELKNIAFWLEVNKLSLNINKTHYIIFTSKKRVAHDVNVCIHNVAIDRATYTKFLCVQIDEKLSWKTHIEYIKKKLSKSTGILVKARKFLPLECLKTLYYTFASTFSLRGLVFVILYSDRSLGDIVLLYSLL